MSGYTQQMPNFGIARLNGKYLPVDRLGLGRNSGLMTAESMSQSLVNVGHGDSWLFRLGTAVAGSIWIILPDEPILSGRSRFDGDLASARANQRQPACRLGNRVGECRTVRIVETPAGAWQADFAGALFR
jgi:hypothetical protein